MRPIRIDFPSMRKYMPIIYIVFITSLFTCLVVALRCVRGTTSSLLVRCKVVCQHGEIVVDGDDEYWLADYASLDGDIKVSVKYKYDAHCQGDTADAVYRINTYRTWTGDTRTEIMRVDVLE